MAISKLLKDEYTRDVQGYLPSANIAFLDELFRGSSAVLNSLLTVLNERTFNNGKELIHTPIQSVVAATNSFPQEESLQAFCDRFLFRPTVEALKKPASRRLLDLWALGLKKRPNVESELTYEDLIELQESLSEVKVTDEFLDKFSQVFDLLASRGITISDRRRVQILKFIKGWAIVQGDDTVYADHLHKSLVHIIYQNVDDIGVIKEVLQQAIPTAERMIIDIKRALGGILSEYHSINGQECKAVSDLNKLVSKLRKSHNDVSVLDQKLSSIMESSEYRISATTRQEATKVIQTLDQTKQLIAKSISELCK